MSNFNNIDLSFTGNYSLTKSISLASKAAFVDGFSDMQYPELYLAFPLEDSWKPVCIKVSQAQNHLSMTILDNPQDADNEDIVHQVKRILCLDVDGKGFIEIAQ